MPSSSTLSSEEKATIKKVAATSASKVLSAAIARVYYAHPDPSRWAYSGIEGALTLVSTHSGFYFRIIDLLGTRGAIWEHELAEDFDYNQDRTFFYSFTGDECTVGFAFVDEHEASALYKKVNSRKKHAKKKDKSTSSPGKNGSVKKTSKLGGLFKSMIGAPTDFKHVAHMGYDAEKGFTAENVDPEWEKLLQQLGGMGFTKQDIEQNRDFIQDFVKNNPSSPTDNAPSPIAPPPPTRGLPPTRKAAPPPVPPSRTPASPVPQPQHVKRKAPPPVPPSRATNSHAAADVPEPPTLPPPRPSNLPPPIPPQSNVPPAPPLPPSRAPPSTVPQAPPRPASNIPVPPPNPMFSPPPNAPPAPPSRPPVAPPQPPSSVPQAPPMPPHAAPPMPPRAPAADIPDAPAPPAAGLPSTPAGRNDLLASIRGAGGITALKKVDDTPRTATPAEEAPAAGGGDLAAALALALSQRKGNMGEDSDEESDDEWED